MKILEAIYGYEHDAAPARIHTRKLVSTHSLGFRADVIMPSLPERRLDLCLLDVDANTDVQFKNILWQHVALMIEVKCTTADGTYHGIAGEEPNNLKTILNQTADCVHLHLAARPFQVPPYTFMLFGTGFCLTYWITLDQ